MKNSVKNAAIKTISFTGAVLHTTTVGTSIVIHEVAELVFKGSELIAQGEGYVVNKIDSTKSARSIIDHRKDSTNENFARAAMEYQRLQDMAKDLVKQGKEQAAKVITVAKDTIKPKKSILVEITEKKEGVWNILVDSKPVKREKSNFNMRFASEDEAMLWAHENLV